MRQQIQAHPYTSAMRPPDLLTLIRVVIAATIWWPAATGAWGVAGVMLATAWLTDSSDGRLARRMEIEGLLGPYDLAVDTAVGGSLLLGFGLGGEMRLGPWGVLFAVLGLLYAIRGNEAAALLLQAAGYILFFLGSTRAGSHAWILPAGTAAAIGVIDRRRLTDHLLPMFFKAARHPLRRAGEATSSQTTVES